MFEMHELRRINKIVKVKQVICKCEWVIRRKRMLIQGCFGKYLGSRVNSSSGRNNDRRDIKITKIVSYVGGKEEDQKLKCGARNKVERRLS